MQNKVIIYILSCLIFIASAIPADAQLFNKSFWSYGAFGEYIYATHITDFTALPGVPNCCPKFTGGNGGGFALGLLVQYRFYGYNNIYVRLGYQQMNGNLTVIEPEWVVLNNKLTPAQIQHNINTKFAMPFIEPMYKFNTIIGLSFSIGLNCAYIVSASYSQNELLIKPENRGTFENGKRIRNEHSGTLSSTNNFLIFADLTTEFEFNLDRHKLYVLTPRFAFNYGLNSLFKIEKWRITYFSIGISLKINPYYDLSNPLEPN